ncbi:hypothetical protein CEN39_18285, partial [Fischerella thermalis CCMEE 5201]
ELQFKAYSGRGARCEYTSKVRQRRLTKIKGFKPTQVGFVCVAATSSAGVQDPPRAIVPY